MSLQKLTATMVETSSTLSRVAIITLALTANCQVSARQWVGGGNRNLVYFSPNSGLAEVPSEASTTGDAECKSAGRPTAQYVSIASKPKSAGATHARDKFLGHNFVHRPCPPNPKTGMLPPVRLELNIVSTRILEIHNKARFAVGAPPLKWDPQLTAHAKAYAQVLAHTGQLVHSPREGRGTERENLTEAFHGSSPDQLMRYWLIEKRDFHGGIFPNVCKGDWEQCAHYSQMIWPTTTYVGCGLVAGVRWDYFVCRYSPGGNKDGKPVG